MNQNTESLNRFPRSTQHPRDFVPNSYPESVCQNIALTLGEKDMRYLLATLHKCGGDPYQLELAFSTVKDQIRLGKARNPRALFNYIIGKALNTRGGKEI